MRATKPPLKRVPINSMPIKNHIRGAGKEQRRFSFGRVLSAEWDGRLRYLARPKEGHVAAGHV